MVGYGAQTSDQTIEMRSPDVCKMPQHEPMVLSHPVHMGFNCRTGPDNTRQSNSQPGAVPFGKPQCNTTNVKCGPHIYLLYVIGDQ
jgi:hypothetical protein